MKIDYRDLVIAHFAADEAELIKAIVDVTIERDVWRELAKAGIHQIADLTRELKVLRQRHRTLREQTTMRDVREPAA